jgi:hypothetical protein
VSLLGPPFLGSLALVGGALKQCKPTPTLTSVVQQKRESEAEARDENDELPDEDDFLDDTHLIEFLGI